MKERKNLHKQNDTSVLKDIAKKPTIQESVNRCYDDWNQGCDWLIDLKTTLNVIGLLICLIIKLLVKLGNWIIGKIGVF